MFNLEQAVEEWRRQMVKAGIKTPVPLEELESHLREEIERQMKSGLNERRAFEIAAQQIGQTNTLNNEFKKAQAIITTKYISQRFISNMLVIFGVTSLAMLSLEFVTPAIYAARLAGAFQPGKLSLPELYAGFNGNALLNNTIFVHECFILSLILTALFALLRFRLLKQSNKSCDL